MVGLRSCEDGDCYKVGLTYGRGNSLGRVTIEGPLATLASLIAGKYTGIVPCLVTKEKQDEILGDLELAPVRTI